MISYNYLVLVKRIPLTRTNRVEKAFKTSGMLNSRSFTGVTSGLESFDNSLASPLPLPLPVVRAAVVFAATTLELPGSSEKL